MGALHAVAPIAATAATAASARLASAPALAAALAAACALLGGCATYSDGEGARPRREVAIVRADPRVTAGLPLAVNVRQVDGHEVGAAYSRLELTPGRHLLLVDCRFAATRAITRHELDVELEAGGDYRLVAESAPGNQRCGEVRLEAR